MAYVYNLKTGLATVAREGEMKRPNPDLRLISPAIFTAINSGELSKTDIKGFFALASLQGNPNANPDVLLSKKGEVDAKDVRTAPEATLPTPEDVPAPVKPVSPDEPEEFTAIMQRLTDEGPNAVNTMSADSLVILAENIGANTQGKTKVKHLRAAIIARLKEIQDASQSGEGEAFIDSDSDE